MKNFYRKRRSNRREDLEAPRAQAPNTLTFNERKAVRVQVKKGASESDLARYFNTTITEIRAAITHAGYDELDERINNAAKR